MVEKFTNYKNSKVVFLSGEIDQYAAAVLKSKIDLEMEDSKKKNLIIDLKDVSMMDSSGIGLIIGRYKMLAPIGGVVAVSGASNGVRRVISLSGIEKIISHYQTPEEADREIGLLTTKERSEQL